MVHFFIWARTPQDEASLRQNLEVPMRPQHKYEVRPPWGGPGIWRKNRWAPCLPPSGCLGTLKNNFSSRPLFYGSRDIRTALMPLGLSLPDQAGCRQMAWVRFLPDRDAVGWDWCHHNIHFNESGFVWIPSYGKLLQQFVCLLLWMLFLSCTSYSITLTEFTGSWSTDMAIHIFFLRDYGERKKLCNSQMASWLVTLDASMISLIVFNWTIDNEYYILGGHWKLINSFSGISRLALLHWLSS